MATQSETQEYDPTGPGPGDRYVPDSTLEAGVVKTIELGGEWGRPFYGVTVRTDGADIWITLGQRAPKWAWGLAGSARSRHPQPDPGPTAPAPTS